MYMLEHLQLEQVLIIDGLEEYLTIGKWGLQLLVHLMDLLDGLISNVLNFGIQHLSTPNIETLYNNGSPILTLSNVPQDSTSLQGWWKLNASDTYDSSTGILGRSLKTTYWYKRWHKFRNVTSQFSGKVI